ncbi:Peroxiredoxin [Streptomyces fumanus]
MALRRVVPARQRLRRDGHDDGDPGRRQGPRLRAQGQPRRQRGAVRVPRPEERRTVFYPFAFTGVCTGELCEVRDHLPQFADRDTQVLAVSNDSIHTLRVFAEQEGLEYPLLSDFWPHGNVSRAYGVFDEDKGCAVRGTFIIDREGVVRWTVVNGLPDARDLGAYVKALDTL